MLRLLCESHAETHIFHCLLLLFALEAFFNPRIFLHTAPARMEQTVLFSHYRQSSVKSRRLLYEESIVKTSNQKAFPLVW